MLATLIASIPFFNLGYDQIPYHPKCLYYAENPKVFGPMEFNPLADSSVRKS